MKIHEMLLVEDVNIFKTQNMDKLLANVDPAIIDLVWEIIREFLKNVGDVKLVKDFVDIDSSLKTGRLYEYSAQLHRKGVSLCYINFSISLFKNKEQDTPSDPFLAVNISADVLESIRASDNEHSYTLFSKMIRNIKDVSKASAVFSNFGVFLSDVNDWYIDVAMEHGQDIKVLASANDPFTSSHDTNKPCLIAVGGKYRFRSQSIFSDDAFSANDVEKKVF